MEDMFPSLKSCLCEACPRFGDPTFLLVFPFHVGSNRGVGVLPSVAGSPGNKEVSSIERRELVERVILDELCCMFGNVCCPSTRHKDDSSLRSSTRSSPAKLRLFNAGQCRAIHFTVPLDNFGQFSNANVRRCMSLRRPCPPAVEDSIHTWI